MDTVREHGEPWIKVASLGKQVEPENFVRGPLPAGRHPRSEPPCPPEGSRRHYRRRSLKEPTRWTRKPH
ncbi:hypothetical protein [Streptomyces sp. NBC_00334]|uniref:hypothetical protein n=1 Tax=Streptomyces sp. NBC_00334 TaxID=2975713 RepID=UPI002E27C793|nr:hypothetical protein [Streptomyces sp. NBC_00334]